MYQPSRWQSGKEPTHQCRRQKRWGFSPWAGKIPWSRKWQPTPVFLPGKFHGQRSLVGYNPWGRTESDMTAHTVFISQVTIVSPVVKKKEKKKKLRNLNYLTQKRFISGSYYIPISGPLGSLFHIFLLEDPG